MTFGSSELAQASCQTRTGPIEPLWKTWKIIENSMFDQKWSGSTILMVVQSFAIAISIGLIRLVDLEDNPLLL